MIASISTVAVFGICWFLYHLVHQSTRRQIAARYDESVRRYVREFGTSESGTRFISDARLAVVQDDSWILNPIHRTGVHYLVTGSSGQSVAVGLLASAVGCVVGLFSDFGKHKGKTPDQIQLEEEICGIATEYSAHEKQYDWVVMVLTASCVIAAIVAYFA